jgi:indole-3-acetate monooxygenase
VPEFSRITTKRQLRNAETGLLVDAKVENATGLSGTGSHDYVMEDVFVPFEESWNFAERPQCSGPLYRFAPLFLVSHAAVPLGLARAALDAVEDLAQRKESVPDPHKLFGSRLLRDDSRAHEAIAVAEGQLAGRSELCLLQPGRTVGHTHSR